jgi:hypothetical protein
MSIVSAGYQAYAFGVTSTNYGTIRKVYVRAWVYNSAVTTTWNFAAVARYGGSAPVYDKVVVSSAYDTADKTTITNNGSYSGSGSNAGNAVALWGGSWSNLRVGSASEGYCSDDGTNGRDIVSHVSSDEGSSLDKYNA